MSQGSKGPTGDQGARGLPGFQGPPGPAGPVATSNANGTLGNFNVVGNLNVGGVATVATAAAGTNTTQVASTAFVHKAVDDLVGGAGTAYDTLMELQTALNADESIAASLATSVASKAPSESPTFTGTVSGVTAAMVGLGLVDNTADTNKPVSTAAQTALNLKADKTTVTSDISTAINSLVNGAPELLNTLGELSAALNADESAAASLATLVATKAPIESPVFTGSLSAAGGNMTVDVSGKVVINSSLNAPVICTNSFIRNKKSTNSSRDVQIGLTSGNKAALIDVPYEPSIDRRLPYKVLFNGEPTNAYKYVDSSGIAHDQSVVYTHINQMTGSWTSADGDEPGYSMKLQPPGSGRDLSGNINRFSVIADPDKSGSYLLRSYTAPKESWLFLFDNPPAGYAITYDSSNNYSKRNYYNSFLCDNVDHTNYVITFEYKNEYDPDTIVALECDCGIIHRGRNETLTATPKGGLELIPGWVPSTELQTRGAQFDIVSGSWTQNGQYSGNALNDEEFWPSNEKYSVASGGLDFGINSILLKKRQYINSDGTFSNLGWNKVTHVCNNGYYFSWVNGQLNYAYYDPINFFPTGYVGIQSHTPFINYGWNLDTNRHGGVLFKNMLIQETSISAALQFSTGPRGHL